MGPIKGYQWTHWYQLLFVDYGDAVFAGSCTAKPDTPASEYALEIRTLKRGSKETDVEAL